MDSNEIPIPEPCSVPWSAMDGTGCQRFCGQCRKTVTDISQMTERDARAWMAANPEACIQMDVWNERVLFQPERRATRTLRPGRLLRRAAQVVAVAGVGGASPAFASSSADGASLVEWIASWFVEPEAPTPPVVDEPQLHTIDDILIPELGAAKEAPRTERVPVEGPIRRLGGRPVPRDRR